MVLIPQDNTQGCAGKLALWEKRKKQARKRDRKLCFATCAHFYGVNPSTGANFKLPTWPHWHGAGKRWCSPRSWRGRRHRAQSLTARLQKGRLCVPLFYELLQMIVKGGWERRTGLTSRLSRTESTPGCPRTWISPITPSQPTPRRGCAPRLPCAADWRTLLGKQGPGGARLRLKACLCSSRGLRTWVYCLWVSVFAYKIEANTHLPRSWEPGWAASRDSTAGCCHQGLTSWVGGKSLGGLRPV